MKHPSSRAVQLPVTRDLRSRDWSRSLSFVLLALLALLIALVLTMWLYLSPGRISHSISGKVYVATHSSTPGYRDRFGDGTPDFLRLTDPADQGAFRRWFTMIAEDTAARPKQQIPKEITDCASLLRYAYREALRKHDDMWFAATGVAGAPAGEIRKWRYPDTPLKLGLFRVRPGEFVLADLDDGTFAQFADARTLVERNAFLVSRDVRAALPGDLLFYRQFGHSSPWHSMIVTRGGAGGVVVYDTGPDHGEAGELRRVLIAELLDHPQAEWRPVAENPNFLGVFRWNILRGTL